MKITLRIILLILITTSLGALANFLLVKHQADSLHRESEKILAHTLVQSLRDALVQDVIDGNKLRVTDLLRTLQQHNNPIEFLYVSDNNNTIFAHSFEQGFPRYLARDNNHQHLTGILLSAKYLTHTGLIYKYSEPLIPGFDTILHIGINQTEIAEILAKGNQTILITSIIIILFALLFAYVWGHRITTPLMELSHQIQLYGSGNDLDFTSIKTTDTDIRQLSESFQAATEERHQAIAALREREQNLTITLHSIGDAVITTDEKGNVTRMNPVAEQLTGWSFEEAQGLSLKTIFPIVDATTRESIPSPVEKVLDTGKTVFLSNHTTLIARNGTEYQIADSAAPIRNSSGHILGMVLVFNDETEKYQLRSNVKKQLDRFKELSNLALTLTGAPQDVFNEITRLIGRLLEVKVVCLSEVRDGELYFLSVYANGQIYSNTGHCDLSITPCSTVARDKDIQIYQQVAELFPEAAFLKEYDAFSYCGFPALDSNGKVVAVSCLLDDKPHEFTEDDQDLLRIFGQRIGLELEHTHIQDKLRKQDEQLRLSQKMDALGKLTGGVAHDYNNMLGVILGYSELLEGALPEHSKLAKYAHEIHRAGNRGAKLTNKLLSFSRQKSSEAKVLDINTLLRDEQHMLEKILTARIQLELDLADDLWSVCLDNDDLVDAIINTSINAMHAMETAGQLSIQTRNKSIDKAEAQLLNLKAGDYVLLNITDNGIGMSKETQHKIFDPFYTTKGENGTGLGLSQVYGFVHNSGGAIKVHSKLKQGTQLSLYFPRHYESNSNNKLSTAHDKTELSGKETILIVDDEPALRNLTAEILSQHNYNIICAARAKQALEILEHESIDLLLSDVIMPEMNGYQLATIVQEKYPSVKIQLASGFSDEHHMDMDNDTLYQQLLYKPYNSQTLLQRIRELLG